MPIPKFQGNSKFQTPEFVTPVTNWSSEVGAWSFSFRLLLRARRKGKGEARVD
jgi:hypothetical protein